MATDSLRVGRPRALPYLAALALTVSCHAGMLLWLLPAYGSERLGLSPATTGGIAAVYLLLAFGLRAPLARPLDRVGARPVVIYALAGCALSFAAIANATSGWLLLIGAAVHGACAAALWLAGVAALTRISGLEAQSHLLERVLIVEIVAAAAGALTVNLLAYGGVDVAVTGLMVLWIGTVFAALAGLPDDAALPASTRGSARSDEMRAVWSRLPSPVWPLASALAGGAALGMLAVEMFPMATNVLELRPGHAALAAVMAGGGGTLMGLALARQADPLRGGPGTCAAFGLALVLAGIAVRLIPGKAGLAGVVVALLAAFAGAPGCAVAFGGSLVDAVKQAGRERALLAHLAFTLAGATGMAMGALGAGLLWSPERPGAAVNLTAALFWLAAGVYGLRAYVAHRQPPAPTGGP